ncbi:PIN domain-containing protein [Ramlibacter montanisoli]|uniref:DUF4935 domain-containing protein n=1 Tax=Ramlibacter montanisoli TaxID=2732512 RepID=A0A849KTG7_9BURK|nr:PIN domain-containing protein [Ramlibacter montanisoli]NNU45239.1 DUF4935 domain-containing protein [Ramlibacter montanisoli]
MTPSFVFLDTSVLDGQQYNLNSTALVSFIPVAKKHKITLLLPHPTEQEIRRHIKERAREALTRLGTAFREARKSAPFLTGWEHFPEDVSDKVDEAVRVALYEWRLFLGRFNVERLDYEAINLRDVMHWYDTLTPPFREGKKRKEFPDAFALAILAAHAAATGKIIAVVSEDADFQLACDRYHSLLYFKSLPALTEVLLADPSEIEALRAAVLGDPSLLEIGIAIHATESFLSFHIDNRYDVHEWKVAQARITDMRVVALGVGECKVTFEAEIDFEVHLGWSEWDEATEETTSESDWFIETHPFSGAAKLALEANKHIRSVPLVSLNEHLVSFEETPRRR